MRIREGIIILLTITFLMAMSAYHANSQETNLDNATLQAFTKVAKVYDSGGQAPALVEELNDAIALLQESSFARSKGNVTGAVALENEGRLLISDVTAHVPPAQQEADRESTNRLLYAELSVPVIVVVSTLVFYAALRVWGLYEKAKLFEMRVIGRKDKE